MIVLAKREWTSIAPAVALYILFCASSNLGQTLVPDNETPIRVETVLINVPLVVSDRNGRFIGGLTKSDFGLRLDGRDQTIEYFADSQAPISVAIMVDLSGSVIPVLEKIREAAKAFVNKLNPDDQAMLVTFDQKTTIDVRLPLTSDKGKVARRIDELRYDRRGDYLAAHKLPEFPDMYDAIAKVMRREFMGVKTRKAIIVLTDGFIVGQTISATSFDDLIIEGDTAIYPVMFVTPAHLWAPDRKKKDSITKAELFDQPVSKALDRVASRTGGRMLIAAKGTDFDAAFTAVGDELRKQYILGFIPSAESSQRGGRISLSVPDPTWRVRSKSIIRLKRRTDPPTAPVKSH